MKYKKEKIEECVQWVRENGLMEYGGATLAAFCEAMGIDDMTYYSWIRKSEFSEKIKVAKNEFKESLKENIVKSLAKSACGFDKEDITTEYISDKDGKPRIKHQVKKRTHVPPNTGAAIFLLTNLDGETWKNKQQTEGNIKLENTFEELMKSFPDEEVIDDTQK